MGAPEKTVEKIAQPPAYHWIGWILFDDLFRNFTGAFLVSFGLVAP
jgi:hypothetical protein